MSRLLKSRILLSSRRNISTSSVRAVFTTGPAPPRLPPKDQEEFERLQRSSSGAFSSPRPLVAVNQISSSSEALGQSQPQTSHSEAAPPQTNKSPPSQSKETVLLSVEESGTAAVNAQIKATGKGEELHPDVRRGTKPEFDGDVNPKTGEIGGPKNEPLRWGSTGEKGDWSYNGRVTDF